MRSAALQSGVSDEERRERAAGLANRLAQMMMLDESDGEDDNDSRDRDSD